MKNYTEVIADSPWKFVNEILMYMIKPLVLLYLKINGVEIGSNSKFYGFPKIYRTRGSKIVIGKNFECRNWWFSNPLGINHPLILCTWSKNAKIFIGNDVGVSGGSIVANNKITIGNRVLIGANSTIIDTDFHPIYGINKRYSKEGVKSKGVVIGNDVFIGMNVVILKGVEIENQRIVPACVVIH